MPVKYSKESLETVIDLNDKLSMLKTLVQEIESAKMELDHISTFYNLYRLDHNLKVDGCSVVHFGITRSSMESKLQFQYYLAEKDYGPVGGATLENIIFMNNINNNIVPKYTVIGEYNDLDKGKSDLADILNSTEHDVMTTNLTLVRKNQDDKMCKTKRWQLFRKDNNIKNMNYGEAFTYACEFLKIEKLNKQTA